MEDEFSLFRHKNKNVRDLTSNPSVTNNTSLPSPLNELNQPALPTILVVDDDFHVREALKITLGKKFRLIICENGEEGIEKVNSNISTAILDIKMEGKNGFETFIEIKKRFPFVPIIFHSAYQDLKSPLEIINDYHPFGYVIKGSGGKELLHTIDSAIDYFQQINKNLILHQEIQIKEEQYRTLIHNLNVGVYRNTGGPKGKFLQVNPALAQILGYDSVDELMEIVVSDLYENPEDRLILMNTIEQDGYCKNFEIRLQKKDGSLIWASINATAHKDKSGKILWMDGVLNDITETKKAVQQLQGLMQDISALNLNLEQKVLERTSDLNNTLEIILNDLSVAKKIQQNTLLTNFSLIEELTIIPMYIPMSEVGGDFYGISKVSDSTYRIFMADATGHGIQAAMITMAIKGIYDDIKQYDLGVHTIMEILNNEFIEKYFSLKSLFTAFIIDIDVKNHKVKYASAGHPAAVLLQDSKVLLLERTGRMIGVKKDNTYKSTEMKFSPNDRLFIFTDGIFEEFNSNDEEFGEEMLHSILNENRISSIDQTMQIALNKLNLFLEGKEKQDDITIMGIEYKPLSVVED